MNPPAVCSSLPILSTVCMFFSAAPDPSLPSSFSAHFFCTLHPYFEVSQLSFVCSLFLCYYSLRLPPLCSAFPFHAAFTFPTSSLYYFLLFCFSSHHSTKHPLLYYFLLHSTAVCRVFSTFSCCLPLLPVCFICFLCSPCHSHFPCCLPLYILLFSAIFFFLFVYSISSPVRVDDPSRLRCHHSCQYGPCFCIL